MNAESDFHQIAAIFCHEYPVSLAELQGPRRLGRISRPRMMFMFILRELSHHEESIAEFFHRDRTTVLYAEKQVRNWSDTERSTREELEHLRNIIRGIESTKV